MYMKSWYPLERHDSYTNLFSILKDNETTLHKLPIRKSENIAP